MQDGRPFRLLFRHKFPDGVILNLTQCGGVNRSGLKIRPRRFELLRSEKAAHY